jgi:hypothetical protein
MKTRPLIVRAGAVASSLALTAAYVSCRSVGTHADSQAAQTQASTPEERTEPTLFYGTKSGAIEFPQEAAPKPPATAQPQASTQPPARRTLMPGSKSLSPIIPASTPSQTGTPRR